MKYSFILLSLCCVLLTSCGQEGDIPSGGDVIPDIDEWLIPSSSVFDGGPGKDGIPSIDNPNFSIASEVNYLDGGDLVLAITADGITKAYPHPILDWHEIANDRIGSLSLAITYCPLTGTGVGWNRIVDGSETTFGVSGLLYNTNLMPYDRETNSTWSQQRLDCVNGALIGTRAEVYSLVEMQWSTFLEAYPDAQVMNTETGFSRNYDRYPYNDYRTNNSRLLFPIDYSDGRLPQKERTLGVLFSDEQRVYTFDDASNDLNLVLDDLGGRRIAVIRSKRLNVMAAFELNESRQYELIEDDFPRILKDDLGNIYDVLGQLVMGDGPALKLPPQFIGYWFSWGTFYQDIELHGE